MLVQLARARLHGASQWASILQRLRHGGIVPSIPELHVVENLRTQGRKEFVLFHLPYTYADAEDLLGRLEGLLGRLEEISNARCFSFIRDPQPCSAPTDAPQACYDAWRKRRWAQQEYFLLLPETGRFMGHLVFRLTMHLVAQPHDEDNVSVLIHRAEFQSSRRIETPEDGRHKLLLDFMHLVKQCFLGSAASIKCFDDDGSQDLFQESEGDQQERRPGGFVRRFANSILSSVRPDIL